MKRKCTIFCCQDNEKALIEQDNTIRNYLISKNKIINTLYYASQLNIIYIMRI
jgi:hypothetical protein